MSHGKTRTVLAAWVLAALIASQGAASAKPLSSEECEELISEWKGLVSVENMVRQDPQAAVKAGLNAQKLERIKRYLFVEEQLRFRCPGVKLPDVPMPQDANASETPSGPTVPLPLRKPAAPRKGADLAPDAGNAPSETSTMLAGFQVLAPAAQSPHWPRKR